MVADGGNELFFLEKILKLKKWSITHKNSINLSWLTLKCVRRCKVDPTTVRANIVKDHRFSVSFGSI